ncbi:MULTISPECIES: hypothetical protein [unclassified Streptococcus]
MSLERLTTIRLVAAFGGYFYQKQCLMTKTILLNSLTKAGFYVTIS